MKKKPDLHATQSTPRTTIVKIHPDHQPATTHSTSLRPTSHTATISRRPSQRNNQEIRSQPVAHDRFRRSMQPRPVEQSSTRGHYLGLKKLSPSDSKKTTLAGPDAIAPNRIPAATFQQVSRRNPLRPGRQPRQDSAVRHGKIDRATAESEHVVVVFFLRQMMTKSRPFEKPLQVFQDAKTLRNVRGSRKNQTFPEEI